MKKPTISIVLASILLLCGIASAGQFVSGSTSVDGAFNPITNTELQLPPNGIFNFTTVNIPSGVTVTFKKNASNTPVYILATGDVTIAGSINVNGTAGSIMQPGIGGPGGFDGGFGGTISVAGGKGIGPGGGSGAALPTYTTTKGGGGGAYADSYGNERIVPLIGGSGGGGGSGDASYTGGSGGGGGAIMIASSTTVTITGAITVSGGSGSASSSSGGGGGGGSGGAIKIIANTIAGNGTISANGASGGAGGQMCNPYYCCPLSCWKVNGVNGGSGRIRLEANTLSRTTATTPAYTSGYPGPVFVANIPSLWITSIGGVNVSSAPSGSYAAPDITLPATTTNPVAVALSATNIPVGTTVTVSVIPQFGSATNVNTTLSGTDTSSTATANINLSTQYPYIITATATFTIQIAMYYEGEKIEKVMVASTLGKASEVTYITESGREIPSGKLMASLIK